MPRLMQMSQPILEQIWQGHLQEYITAIAWAPTGTLLAIASAAGEVQLLDCASQTVVSLATADCQSVDALAVSADSQFLAAGGQDGRVRIWRLEDCTSSGATTPITTLHAPRTWVDRLAWNPQAPELAYSLGRYAQVWDAAAEQVVATAAFENSSVLDLAWHPLGEQLAVSGHQGLKFWQRQDWHEAPLVLELPVASLAVSWSPDGCFLASGNLDRTLLVWPSDYLDRPWRMRGFPGKVRQICWSSNAVGPASLLAMATAEAVVVWRKSERDTDGWTAQVLDVHRDRVEAIAFQPGTMLLSSAAADGWVCLWKKARQVVQVLKESEQQGFSSLAWHPEGQYLAVGSQAGGWKIWRRNARGKGFR
jgi:WD40 repeat protein